jgi:hypothetical protein
VDRDYRAVEYVHCGGVYCNRDDVDKYSNDLIWKEDAYVDSESVSQDGSVAAGGKEDLIGICSLYLPIEYPYYATLVPY